MPRVAVITDSNSGITQMDGKNMGISVLPMPFTIDDKTYYEDINLTREEFFQMMADGRDIMTSQPSPGDVMDLWDKALEKNDQVVYIPMSSGLSSSCQNARMLANDYKGRVFVVNNQRISVTQKRSVQDAMNMAENGYDAARIRDILERERLDASIYIMLDTLKYLKKGGRITPAAAAIGTLMRIKPVLQIKGERLDAFSKARTPGSAVCLYPRSLTGLTGIRLIWAFRGPASCASICASCAESFTSRIRLYSKVTCRPVVSK